MVVENLPLTILKVVNKSGIGKASQKPYDFDVASVVDDEANVFNFNVSDELSEKIGKVGLAEIKTLDVLASVRFSPKGFDVAGTLTAFKPVK